MSGTSSLGTLLVQRMDAVLGTAVASHPHMVTGLRADAVAAPGAPERLNPVDSADREPVASPEEQKQTRLSTVAGSRHTSMDQATARPEILRGPHVPSPSTALVLGPAARLIQAAFQSPTPAALPASQTPLISAQQASPPDPTAVAHVLARTMQNSGVFYEAHLAAWVAGRYPASRLAEEPQARWKQLPRSSAAEGAAVVGRRTEISDIPTQAMPLVRQQLETLATQQLVWHGQAWQDVPFEWSVGALAAPPTRVAPDAAAMQDIEQSGDDDANASATSDPVTWRSTLSVTLPTLGQTDVELVWQHDRLTLRIAGAEALAEDADALRHDLARCGLTAVTLDWPDGAA